MRSHSALSDCALTGSLWPPPSAAKPPLPPSSRTASVLQTALTPPRTFFYLRRTSPRFKLPHKSPLAAFRKPASFIMHLLQVFTPTLTAKPPPNNYQQLSSSPSRASGGHRHLPHLDGLRAVALFGVLLFHFEVSHSQGGFAGVDVFLSLSGFLITRNIIRDLSEGTFSLRRFYTRRFFRLYPAATTVVAGSVLASFFTFPDNLAKGTVESALASMGFSSNVYFHIQEGYFDSSAVLKPLLHTWSLSLEEQFYFLWAPLLVLVSCLRRPVAYSITIAILCLISLVAAISLAKEYPSFVFYQLPPRIFQFALGALLSATHFEVGPGLLPDVLATSSLSVIVLSFFFLPKGAGPLHMLPVSVATCFLIVLPNTAVSNMFLSDPFARYIGRLSYAAYLVHWPLYVFVRHMMSALSLGPPLPILLMVATMALAWALHHSVENPGRFGATKLRPRFAVLVLVLTTASFCIFGLQTKGFSFRTRGLDGTGLPEPLASNPPKLYKHCKKRKTEKKSNLVHCKVGDLKRGKRSNIALFGDSFTQQLVTGLSQMGTRRGRWYDVRYRTGCKFLPRSQRNSLAQKPIDPGSSKDCVLVHDQMWRMVKSLPKGSTVAVSNSWWFSTPQALESTVREMDRDVRKLGHNLMLIEEPPGIHESFASYFDCADLALMPLGRLAAWISGQTFRGAARCADVKRGLPPYEGRAWQNRAYHDLVNNKLPHVQFVDLFSSLCRNETGAKGQKTLCELPAYTKGVVYDIGYKRDMRHLTFAGSHYIANIMERELFEGDDAPESRRRRKP